MSAAPTKEKNPAKELKKTLLQLQHTRNRALVSWATHKIVTYEDMLVDAGHNRDVLRCYWYNQSQLDSPLSREQILEFYDRHRIAIEQSYDGTLTSFQYNFAPHEYEGYNYTGLKTNGASVNIVDPDNIIAGDELLPDEVLPPSTRQVCQLYPFQERAATKLLYNILHRDYRGQLLRAPVGIGKTYIIAAVIDRLSQMGFFKGKTHSPWPIVYITKASIVEQTERDLRQEFGIDVVNECRVINVEQLRSIFGQLMVEYKTVVVRGEEQIKWIWRPHIHPVFLLLDECQQVKNEDSQQSQILQAYNDLRDIPTYQIHFSATPFMRVCEAKCFAVSTRLPTKYGVQSGVPLSNENWKDFSKHTAEPAEPDEYCPAAVKRLVEKLDPYIVEVKGVRPQFNAHNSVTFTHFKSPEESKFYWDAWKRYEERKKKIEGYDLSASQSRFLVLAQFTTFCKAAELCHAEDVADRMYNDVQNGLAAALAFRYKGTCRRVVQILHDKYGVDRDDISLIWGGGKTKKNEKQKKKENLLTNDVAVKIMADLGLTLTDLQLSEVDDYVDDDADNKITTSLRLGAQSRAHRQEEIDRFQTGKSHYCLFSYKAGGVGLSLHHTDRYTKAKCRRKKNGWVFPEDIPQIPTRQRKCYLIFPLSAVELVQGLGRCPRLTSLSETFQEVLCYAGTIEERVGHLVSLKLKCLREVVRNIKESWEGVILKSHSDTTTIIPNGMVETASEADNTVALFGDATDDDEEEE